MTTPTKVGQIEVIKRVARWHTCEECGMPASWKVTFLLPNFRSNPASKAYRHDDCSWCSDHETYTCNKHRREVEYSDPYGMTHCSSFPLKNFKHMGFYWKVLEGK